MMSSDFLWPPLPSKLSIRNEHNTLTLSLSVFLTIYVCLSQMQSLQEGEDAMQRLDQMEALYYELQLQLYDIQAEVLRCEELLLNAQLTSLRRQITGNTTHFIPVAANEHSD